MTCAGATPMLTAPQFPHVFACTWYSITFGGGGGDASSTCRFCTPLTSAPARSAPQQPHATGPHSAISPGSADCLKVEDGAPGCLPGARPDRPRKDRSLLFFLYGLSEDGGFDDVEESLPRRRSSSPTRATSTASCASLAASCAAASSSRAAAASRSAAFAASSSATRARSAASAGSGTDGVSGTSHHDQHIRTVIKPTRRAGPPKISRSPPAGHLEPTQAE